MKTFALHLRAEDNEGEREEKARMKTTGQRRRSTSLLFLRLFPLSFFFLFSSEGTERRRRCREAVKQSAGTRRVAADFNGREYVAVLSDLHNGAGVRCSSRIWVWRTENNISLQPTETFQRRALFFFFFAHVPYSHTMAKRMRKMSTYTDKVTNVRLAGVQYTLNTSPVLAE